MLRHMSARRSAFQIGPESADADLQDIVNPKLVCFTLSSLILWDFVDFVRNVCIHLQDKNENESASPDEGSDCCFRDLQL